MGLIPNEALEAIRAKIDVAELVSEYVPGLARAGRNLKARCPFHQERTPSFIVSPEKQTFHCFGCGEGGDVFSFLMKIESLTFSEAAEKLAEKAGVKIARTEEALGPEQKRKLKLKELLAFAAEFYHKTLLESPSAEGARKYLAGRKVSAAAQKTFSLGFAPGAGSLIQAAAKKGFAPELVLEAGLAAPSKTGGRPRDYFYDRVVFPIWDSRGAVVGFGGRILGSGEPKYLNTPESPVFSKGRVLYGLFQGQPAIRKARQVCLMEGYMDVIAAHQHGLTTACAPLGTALTADHAALVKRTAGAEGKVIVIFDADNAGLSAAIRGAEVLLSAGLDVRIAKVPSGKDPDEHLHAHGVESFEKCLEEAQDLAGFKTDLLISRAGPLTAQAKSSIARQVLATIEQSPDEIVKAEWLRRLAQRLGTSEDALRRELGKVSSPPLAQTGPGTAPLTRQEVSFADKQILTHLLKKPQLAGRFQDGDLDSETTRAVVKALTALKPWAEGWPARLLESLQGPERGLASGLLAENASVLVENHEEVLEGILRRRHGESRRRQLEKLLHEGKLSDTKDIEEYRRLTSELKGLRR